MNHKYKLKQINECCSGCRYAKDDMLRCILGEQFICKFQPSKVEWNGWCEKWQKRIKRSE